MKPATSADTDWVILNIWLAVSCIYYIEQAGWVINAMLLLSMAVCVMNSVRSYLARRKEPKP